MFGSEQGEKQSIKYRMLKIPNTSEKALNLFTIRLSAHAPT